MAVAIPLTRGLAALVDEEDVEAARQHKWWVTGSGEPYAVTKMLINGSRKSILMHRFLLGLVPGDGRIVDHRNRNTLDNRRENIRICSPRQNSHNRVGNRSNKSGFKGVVVTRGKFRAQITIDGENWYIGIFERAEDAAYAYDRYAKKLHGHFALLNFPEAG